MNENIILKHTLVSDVPNEPACASFPLFGVGQADPLGCHRADVVVGVEVGLLNLASIDHINNIIYGDAGRKTSRSQMN